MTRGDDVVLRCRDLGAALAFYTHELGFRLDSIFPADDPRTAVLSGHGLRLRLQRGDGDRDAVAPTAPVTFAVGKLTADARWVEGRAGMLYRDLLPDRQGGRLIASHIEIPVGGPVADYVHYHRVRFQLIYCHAGWVRVVYEDQGPPFVLRAGDCVLQPPQIRHRVLECSDGLAVIEISSPAEHETHADHALTLPTPVVRANRSFDGQRFVRHRAEAATWQSGPPGFASRDLGIAAATDDLAGARVLRPTTTAAALGEHRDLLRFWFVLRGGSSLTAAGSSYDLAAGDACVLPPRMRHAVDACSADLELLEVSLRR